MTHRHCFEALDRTFQDLRNCQRPFGGMTMVFGGDFQQILPVIPKGSRADIVGASLRKSHLWNNMTVLKLRQNMRLQKSPQHALFAQWLLDVGHSRNLDTNHTISLPSTMVTHDEDILINTIFPDILSCTIRVTPFPCIPVRSRSFPFIPVQSLSFFHVPITFRPLIITFRTSLRYSFIFPF